MERGGGEELGMVAYVWVYIDWLVCMGMCVCVILGYRYGRGCACLSMGPIVYR